jgi:hypothetical protein
MASHNVPDEVFLKTLKVLEECGGNKSEAARRLGFAPSSVRDHIITATRRGLIANPIPYNTGEKDRLIASLQAELDAAREAAKTAFRPHFTVRQDTSGRTSKIRLVCIGDAHDSPAIEDKSRFAWIGAYINETKPDVVVQIGDFATMDSLNSHIGNHTYSGRAKPTFINDMVSFSSAIEAMQLNGVERHCTLGNHERRLWLAEEEAPHSFGMMQLELQKVFEKHSWTYSPYGQITYYGGVGFVHAALNKLGKTYGGKTAENQIANDSLHDLVIGHSHVERRHRAAKIGGNNSVTIVNVGCALPDQHIEEYAHHSLTGWSYGIADMVIQHGRVQDYHFVSMAHLGERYGKA